MSTNKLVLIDGSSYLYRAFHATSRAGMATSSGQPTGAVRTITNMIKKLRDQQQTDYFAVVFDAKGKTFRHDMYKEYKANRPPMPDELRSQVNYVHQIIEAQGIPLVIESGVEADDVIGTLAKRAEEQGLDVLISTGDKDMAQLVTDKVTIIDTMSDSTYDPEGVEEKFGVTPDQIIDYLALMGDSSDNIPGVPKCGPKTAVKWLVEYKDIDNLLVNQDKIGGKIGENLRASVDQLAMSKDLATIRCDLELGIMLNDLQVTPEKHDELVSLYQELEFTSFLNAMGVAALDGDDTATPVVERNYSIISTEAELDSWIEKLNSAEFFAFDTETTSLNTQQAKLVGMSFCGVAGEAAYLPLAHTVGQVEQLDFDLALSKVKPLLEDASAKKVGQNLKYDLNVLKNYDVDLKGIAYDTMLESYVLDSVGRHDMDTISKKYLGIEPISFESIAGKGKKQLTFDQIEIEQAAEYAAEDADITLQLHNAISNKLLKDPTLSKVFDEIELPLLDVLATIERNGVKIDSDMLFIQSQELGAKMDEIERQAYEAADGEFNLASPKQIQEILFERMSIPVIRKTPKGQPSTAEDVLQELALTYDLPRLILEHRSLGKLKSTYTDKLPLMVDPETQRVHTSYHQAVAVTGRLSSSEPNLQNIPIRSAEGRRIREAFVVDDGCVMMAADYSQVELRIMAHLSEDETLIKAFQEGADIHTATAAEILGSDLESVESEDRRRAKAINFGLIYGMSAFGLAKQLGILRGEAQDYIDLYFARYPGVKAYMDKTKEEAKETGYVETVFGRRLYLPDINAKNGQRRQYAERTAINAPMQGTAADLIKMAMIEVQNQLIDKQINSKMIMQVHDELVFEVPKEEYDVMHNLIKQSMENIAELKVPLIVDIGDGINWDEAH